MMKINEVLQPSENALFEAIDPTNDSGFSTRDLVKVIKSKNGPWGKPMTGDEFENHLNEMARKYGAAL